MALARHLLEFQFKGIFVVEDKFSLNFHLVRNQVVSCSDVLARLWPGFQWLGLWKSAGQAKAVKHGWLWPVVVKYTVNQIY